MPAPGRRLPKNATGLLKGTHQLAHRGPNVKRSVSFHNPAFATSSTNTRTRNIHYTPQLSKQRQLTPSSSSTPPTIPSQQDILAELAASAWSTSIVNTGYPFYNEFPSFAEPQDPFPPAPPSAQASKPPIDFATIFWTTSPANPGAIISDSIFALPSFDIPARSLEAYDNIMASDEDYQAFLDKAAQDHQPQQSTQSKTAHPAQQKINTQSLHPALQNVHQHTYVSDADEAFEPVSLIREQGKTGSIDVKEVANIAGSDVKESDVEELSMSEFDPRGEYKQVVKQVEDASKGGVKVWRFERGGARVEYWVLGLSTDGHVVGARAKAVES